MTEIDEDDFLSPEPEPESTAEHDENNPQSGVSITWLANALRMAPLTVKRKLADIPPLRKFRNGYIYNFKQAMEMLVEPKVDIASWVKTLRPADLPPYLQEAFWAAQVKRQLWETNAKDLWKTDDVLEVFGETFKTIKHTIQLWVEDLDRDTELTGKQREVLVRYTDALQASIYSSLLDIPKRRKTPPTLAQLSETDPNTLETEDGVS